MLGPGKEVVLVAGSVGHVLTVSETADNIARPRFAGERPRRSVGQSGGGVLPRGGARGAAGDHRDRNRKQQHQAAENDKALARTPAVGGHAHRRRDHDRRQPVHRLAQPDDRSLPVTSDGLGLDREHHRLDDALQPATRGLRQEQQHEDAAEKRGCRDQQDRGHRAAKHRTLRVAQSHRSPGEQRAQAARYLDGGKEDPDRGAGQPDAVEINHIERALHAVGRSAQEDYGHRRRHRRDRHQREAAHIVGQSGTTSRARKLAGRRGPRPSAPAISASGARNSAIVSSPPQATPIRYDGHAPPKSQTMPATIGIPIEPMRAKKLNRSIYSASPSDSWAIRVWEPDQANCNAPPLTVCNNSSGQNQGITGKSGAEAIATQIKNKVTRRVPYRSISTPIWIDRNTARNERAPTNRPIWPALIPSDRP